jgi:succinate dehydrogenase/fumarate reductase flavoprotein subunit
MDRDELEQSATIDTVNAINNGRAINRRDLLKGMMAAGAITAVGLSGCSPQTPEQPAGGEAPAETPAGTSPDSGPATSGASGADGFMNAAKASQKWEFEIPPEPVAESEITETFETDIVVIGAGVAGMTCAAAATEQGADVILFAASSYPVSRGGSNHGVNTKVQQRYGIEYTPEILSTRLKKELSDASFWPDSRKWWKWVNNSSESMNWLIDIMEGAGYETTLEIGFDDPDGVYSAQPASHNWIGGEVVFGAAMGQGLVMNELEKKILAQNGTIHYDTTAQYLIREGDNTGPVTGVVAKNPQGAYVKYVGKKAIILATGDFSGNKEMMAKYCPHVLPILADVPVDYNAQFSFGGLYHGDGQRMGLWVGAAWQKTFPNAPMIDSLGPAPYTQSVANHTGINLNTEGQRYMNEDTIFSYSCLALMQNPEMTAYYVWDSAYANWFDHWFTFGSTIEQTGGPKGLSPEEALASWEANVENKSYVKGDSIEEVLSQLEGIDAEAAKATIERYNGYCDAGIDEEYHKHASYLAPIKTGPFYGCKFTANPANFLCVTGGLRTNDRMQVCDENDSPIPGLYNIGIMVGDMYANCYNFSICGHNLGATCNTFAYMLGRELASA